MELVLPQQLPVPSSDASNNLLERTMVKAKEVKRRADSMLEELFRSMFEEIDTDKLKKEVDELRAGAPAFEAAQHSRVLARRTAIRCAAAGAVTGLPLGLAARDAADMAGEDVGADREGIGDARDVRDRVRPASGAPPAMRAVFLCSDFLVFT